MLTGTIGDRPRPVLPDSRLFLPVSTPGGDAGHAVDHFLCGAEIVCRVGQFPEPLQTQRCRDILDSRQHVKERRPVSVASMRWSEIGPAWPKIPAMAAGGTPASSSAVAIASTQPGVPCDGMQMVAQPAPRRPRTSWTRAPLEIPRREGRHHADGMVLDLDAAAQRAARHDPVRNGPGLLAAPFEEIGGSLDLGLVQRLALLERQRARHRLDVGAQDVGGPFSRSGHAPTGSPPAIRETRGRRWQRPRPGLRGRHRRPGRCSRPSPD